MASVYRNLYITITASSTKTSSKSLFLERFDIANYPVCIDLGEEQSGSDTRWIYSSRRPLTEYIKNNPLQQQGWTLQKTQLSVRVLYEHSHLGHHDSAGKKQLGKELNRNIPRSS
jgi:hypothetical protein